MTQRQAPMPPTRPTAPPEPAGPDQPAPALATLIVVPPPPDLAPLVEYVWQLELAGGAPEGAVWRVVADGYVDLAMRVALDAEPMREVAETPERIAARAGAVEVVACSPAVVCGAAAAARALPMDRPRLLTGARFRLGSAAAALRNAPAELVDGARALGDVLDGRAAGDVSRARADDAPRHVAGYGCGGAVRPDAATVAAVVRAIARASLVAAVRRLVARAEARRQRVAPDPRVQAALALLDGRATAGDPARVPDGARVAWLCRELAVSKRTLERLFAEHVGFAPRDYQRLRRVGAVASAIEREASGRAAAAPATLSEVAYRVGYADHAHMTREFGRVMGVTPSAYRREALASPVARRVGAVDFDRPTPLGTVGDRSAA